MSSSRPGAVLGEVISAVEGKEIVGPAVERSANIRRVSLGGTSRAIKPHHQQQVGLIRMGGADKNHRPEASR